MVKALSGVKEVCTGRGVVGGGTWGIGNWTENVSIKFLGYPLVITSSFLAQHLDSELTS